MCVLTVRQPWAWAIVYGGKDVENRVRSLGPYRGPVAIHAGLGWSWQGAEDWEVRRAVRSLQVGWPADDGEVWAGDTIESDDPEFVAGAVIGVVDLVDQHNHEDPRPNSPRHVIPAECPSPWAMPDHHHLVLANPRVLPRPIPATGRLGLWRPDDTLLAAITVQLQEVA
jgi:hypothetical protein